MISEITGQDLIQRTHWNRDFCRSIVKMLAEVGMAIVEKEKLDKLVNRMEDDLR